MNPLPCGISLSTYFIYLAEAEISDKIGFIFDLMDVNRDKFLNDADLYVILRCATKGFAKLKGAAAPPDSTLVKIISALAKKKLKSPENGEIGLRQVSTRHIRIIYLND